MCHSVKRNIEDWKIARIHGKIEGKQLEKGENGELLILNSYEKTRKFEKALSFTHCTCLNVWKKCPCVIWKFSCVSRLKNGSLGSFRGLGLRPRPQKEPWLPFFNLDTQENFQITLGQFFQTLRQDNAWRKEPFHH